MSLLRLATLLWPGLDPWPGNFRMPRVRPKKNYVKGLEEFLAIRVHVLVVSVVVVIIIIAFNPYKAKREILSLAPLYGEETETQRG